MFLKIQPLATTNKLKIFNDPIYGFIGTPNELIYNLINHPFFQRLRRIAQMGLSFLVYPGAHHTRFHHALGSMHLMRQAVEVLKAKGVLITPQEEQGLLVAILLHDIGHGPFSHALEGHLVTNQSHEALSLAFMHQLNKEFNGALQVAIAIFKGAHPKPFLNQLVSSQLDMDRLDYLRRDSFFTGVTEGNISSQRLLSMLNVQNNQLVVEEKGIYSVEKFLMARRFMYWQVYLHKTSLVAELMLIKVIKRAKYLLANKVSIGCSPALYYFLEQNKVQSSLQNLKLFAQLDDTDIIAALKNWQDHDDFVLRTLSTNLLNRNLLKIKLRKRPFDQTKVKTILQKVAQSYNISTALAANFVYVGTVANTAYNSSNQKISILRKNGKLIDVAKASDHLNIQALSKKVTKYYLCFPQKSV